jgi:hypothetical protein
MTILILLFEGRPVEPVRDDVVENQIFTHDRNDNHRDFCYGIFKISENSRGIAAAESIDLSSWEDRCSAVKWNASC